MLLGVHKGIELNWIEWSQRNGNEWNVFKGNEWNGIKWGDGNDFNFFHLCLVEEWKSEWIENRICIYLLSCLYKEKKSIVME